MFFKFLIQNKIHAVILLGYQLISASLYSYYSSISAIGIFNIYQKQILPLYWAFLVILVVDYAVFAFHNYKKPEIEDKTNLQ
jgi:hypothetical protein